MHLMLIMCGFFVMFCEIDLMKRKPHKEINGGKEEKEKIRPGLMEISSEGTGFADGGKNMAKREGWLFNANKR